MTVNFKKKLVSIPVLINQFVYCSELPIQHGDWSDWNMSASEYSEVYLADQ